MAAPISGVVKAVNVRCVPIAAPSPATRSETKGEGDIGTTSARLGTDDSTPRAGAVEAVAGGVDVGGLS